MSFSPAALTFPRATRVEAAHPGKGLYKPANTKCAVVSCSSALCMRYTKKKLAHPGQSLCIQAYIYVYAYVCVCTYTYTLPRALQTHVPCTNMALLCQVFETPYMLFYMYNRFQGFSYGPLLWAPNLDPHTCELQHTVCKRGAHRTDPARVKAAHNKGPKEISLIYAYNVNICIYISYIRRSLSARMLSICVSIGQSTYLHT